MKMTIPEEITDKFWGKIIGFINDHGLWDNLTVIFLLLIAIWIISIVFTWLMARKKDKHEIYKLSAERTKSQIENLEHLHNVEENYQKQQELLNLYLGSLVDSLRSNKSVNEIYNLREELINHFSSSFLFSFDKYIDFYSIVRNKKECQIFFDIHINKLLHTIEEILEVINNTDIIEATGLSPYVLSEDSLKAIDLFYRKTFSNIRIVKKIKFNKKLNHVYTRNT